jgi:hypothetical protein|tara:strand:- start:4739 stop:5017 length:279 start_codon:yes stop_codon:yes gene_type:complete
MSDLIEGAESSIEVKEAPKTDWKGAFNFATIAVVGVLALLGMSFSDFLFKKPTKAANESKRDEDTVADYEKEYLDEDISEEALDEHTVGLTA